MSSAQRHQLELGAPAGETRVRAGSILRAAAHGTRLDADRRLANTHLVVLAGSRAGQRFAIGHSQTLGRGREATIRLQDSEVSRLHARICTADGSAHLEDLNSKNGVCLNGKRLRGHRSVLEPGDEITIGSTTMALVAASGESPPTSAPETRTSPPTSQILNRAWWVLLQNRPMLALAGALALLAAAVCLGIAAM